MSVVLIWHSQARQDLLDIYIAIGLENQGAAEKFFDAIEERAEMLIDHPRIGPRRPDIFPSARMLIERPYIIFYETLPNTDDTPIKTVEIVRIIDGRRDLAEVF